VAFGFGSGEEKASRSRRPPSFGERRTGHHRHDAPPSPCPGAFAARDDTCTGESRATIQPDRVTRQRVRRLQGLHCLRTGRISPPFCAAPDAASRRRRGEGESRHAAPFHVRGCTRSPCTSHQSKSCPAAVPYSHHSPLAPAATLPLPIRIAIREVFPSSCQTCTKYSCVHMHVSWRQDYPCL
jgi:hypothetical protein